MCLIWMCPWFKARLCVVLVPYGPIERGYTICVQNIHCTVQGLTSKGIIGGTLPLRFFLRNSLLIFLFVDRAVKPWLWCST